MGTSVPQPIRVFVELFERYFEIAQKLNIKVAVVTDNDGEYNRKVTEKYKEYKGFDNIEIFAEKNEKFYTCPTINLKTKGLKFKNPKDDYHLKYR